MRKRRKHMKHYKDNIDYIGSSDYSSLILAGHVNEQGFTTQELHFGCDGEYWAYEIDETYEVPDHYDLVAEFDHWVKIYDDSELTKHHRGKKIKIYRAWDFGALVQIIK